eukprot:1323433-Pleurochrysis_carterae.AAC.2
MQQLMRLVALRERRALSVPSCGSSQLAAFGKMQAERKLRLSVPDVFKGVVPSDHQFTCKAMFRSVLLEEFPLMYSLEGKCIVHVADAKSSEATVFARYNTTVTLHYGASSNFNEAISN